MKRIFGATLSLLLTIIIAATLLATTASAEESLQMGGFGKTDEGLRLETLYCNYHDVQGLPPAFKDYIANESACIFSLRGSFDAVYCIEMNNGDLGNLSNCSTPSNLNTPKENMLMYVLTHGAKRIAPSDLNEEELELYAATQIAVWMIIEDCYGSPEFMDAVLYPASDIPGMEGFAQTPGVGRLARRLIEGAISAVSSPGVSVYPSFVSTSVASAPTYIMDRTGDSYSITLTDDNGVLRDDWQTYLTAFSDAGMAITVRGNTMTITGDPGAGTEFTVPGEPDSGKTVVLKSTMRDASMVYYNADSVDQTMARYARVLETGTPVTLYFRLIAPPLETPPVDTPSNYTPPRETPPKENVPPTPPKTPEPLVTPKLSPEPPKPDDMTTVPGNPPPQSGWDVDETPPPDELPKTGDTGMYGWLSAVLVCSIFIVLLVFLKKLEAESE